jgi:hypothetical protein
MRIAMDQKDKRYRELEVQLLHTTNRAIYPAPIPDPKNHGRTRISLPDLEKFDGSKPFYI